MQKFIVRIKTFAATNIYTLDASSTRVSFRWALEPVHIIFFWMLDLEQNTPYLYAKTIINDRSKYMDYENHVLNVLVIT